MQFFPEAQRQSWVRLGLWCVFFVAPHRAQAQLASSFSSAVLSGWSAGIGTTGGYEDGQQFLNGAGVRAASVGVGASASKLWRLRSNSIDGTVAGGLIQYPQQPVLNQKTYQFGGGLVHTFSRTTSAQVRGDLSEFYASRAIGGTGPGVLLGRLVQTRTRAASGALRTQFGRAIQASVTGNVQEVSSSTPGFGIGRFAGAGVALGGQLNRETSLGLAANYQYSRLAGISANLPFVSGSIEHRRRSSLFARFSAGAAVGSLEVSALSRIFGSLTAGYTSRFAEFSIEGQRTIGQQFGIDSAALQEINSASISVSKNVTRQLSAGVGAGFGSFNGVGPAGAVSRQASYSASARYQFNRAMLLLLQGSFREQSGVFNLNSKIVTATFTYTWSQSRRAEPAAP